MTGDGSLHPTAPTTGRAGRRAALFLAIVAATPLGALMLWGATAPAAEGPRPFGIPCKAENAVRFCEGGPGIPRDRRVESFDGQPLDVDVTLPANGRGPWPTVVMLHGWGHSKTQFETDDPKRSGVSVTGPLVQNLELARRGYAVVNYTARGFVGSCGSLTGNLVEGNGTGSFGCPGDSFTHFADQRREVRDTQHLAGMLADQGIARPAIAVIGVSYGGGQALQLAKLRDRVRLPDGSLGEWRSPRGRAMSIGVVYASVPWSDLADALLPNGRTPAGPRDASAPAGPPGVMRDSWDEALFLSGALVGRYAKPGTTSSADIVGWFDRLRQGEPYDVPFIEAMIREVKTFHSAVGVPADGPPSPVFVVSGWTDMLFPPSQGIRFFDDALAADPDAAVALRLGDVGHPMGQNKERNATAISGEAMEFLDFHLRGAGRSPSGVKAWGTTCPSTATASGPWSARRVSGLAGERRVISSDAVQVVEAGAGSEKLGWATDPVPMVGDLGVPWPGPDLMSAAAMLPAGSLPVLERSSICRVSDASREAGVAHYEVGAGRGMTMIGLPTVEADVVVRGGAPAGELAARLWDVFPQGEEQRLVTRGIYRLTPDQRGRISFELFGNAYSFAPGHRIKLELLGRDSRTFRASNNSRFTVRIERASLTLRVRR